MDNLLAAIRVAVLAVITEFDAPCADPLGSVNSVRVQVLFKVNGLLLDAAREVMDFQASQASKED